MRRSVCFLSDCDVFVTFRVNLRRVYLGPGGGYTGDNHLWDGDHRVRNELSLNCVFLDCVF